MRAISSLISVTQPSIVAIQSGVLILFMAAFVYVLFRLIGDKKRRQLDDIGRRALED